MNNLQKIWNMMKGYRLMYGVAILFMGFGAIFAYYSPLILRATIDSVIGTEAFSGRREIIWLFTALGGREVLSQRLWIPGILLVSSALVQGIFVFLSGYLAAKASEGSARDLRNRLYHHLQYLPFAYHARSEKGDLLQRCTSDVDTVRKFLALQLVQVGNAIFLVTVSLVVTFQVHVELAWVAMPIIPLATVASILFFGKIQSSFRRSDEAEAALTSMVQEHLTGIRVVRAFGREGYEYGRFKALNEDYRRVTMRLIQWFAAFWASTDIMSLTQVLAVICVGTLWAVQGTVTIGTLILFVSSVWMILWPVRQMGRVLVDMGKAFVAMERIQEILDQEPESMNPQGIRQKLTGAIEFKGVSLEYESGSPVLQDLNFTIESGQTVGILGHTGSGKTSLVGLIAGFYAPTQGSISIDGVPLQDFDKAWLRRQVSLVLQEPFLYAKTIKRNIGVGARNISEVEIFEAARDASIHQSIVDFEAGYDTPVGERGVTLSGGQKQRVAIARALVAQAPILIFDDSLSALDTETDRAVQEAIRKRASDRTVMLISHRLSTLMKADLVLVMENGRLVEQGSPAQLLEHDGLFSRLHALQNQGIEV